ncbi:MAG: DUF536 domain-containing protein [Acidobacteriota bacterium]|nr:DUF536 domain-containing protein [Acidobacteriota bacterium]
MIKRIQGVIAGVLMLTGVLSIPVTASSQAAKIAGPADAVAPQASVEGRSSSTSTRSVGTGGADADAVPHRAKQASGVETLRQQIRVQEKEIGELRSALAKQQQLLGQLTAPQSTQGAKSLPAARAKPKSPGRQAAATAVQAKGTAYSVVASAGPPPAVNGPDTSNSSGGSGAQQYQNPALTNSPVQPLPLKIGSATLTPVGFVDATAFFRTRNLGSGIGAAFGSLPFSNTLQGRLTENRFTIQNSRIGMMMDSAFGANKVRAYLETDFLGAQPTNAFVTSNSDSLRMRLYWVDIQRGKFEFLGGQSWSLLTPGRIGISPMPSDLFYTQNMDTNYQVGLTWARQLQFRFVYHASPNVTAALSLENAEQYVGSSGTVKFPSSFNTAQVGNGGSTSTPNLAPDVIGKIAFDGHAGRKQIHVELAGLLSSFKIVNPTLTASDTAVGAGGSVNFNLELAKNFRLIATSFYSDGGGRYIFGLGPDFVVRPDYTISTVHAYSGIGGFEYNISPSTLIYGYYGGAYFGRNYSVTPNSTPGGPPVFTGFGYPSSPDAANKSIQEGTFGIIQTFWKSQRYGALQLITQYSYLTRAPWFVAPGSPKNANLSEAYADIRYVIP